MDLTLRHLHYFVATVDAGSMTRAAARLNVSPTALSLQLKAVEDGFGVIVLQRSSRGVVPTEVGQELLKLARDILAKVDVSERFLYARAEAPVRVLRLGLPPALTRLIGPAILTGFSRRFPGHTLEVIDGWSRDLERKLQSGEIDLLVGYVEAGLAGLYVLPVAQDSLVFVEAARSGAATGPISVAELLTTDLVFYGKNSVGWKAVSALAVQSHLTIGMERQVESIDIWRHLICRGGCTSVTSVGAVIDEIERGEVTVRELADGPIVHSIGLAIRQDRSNEDWASPMLEFITGLLDAELVRTRNHLRRIPEPL
jgi:LysR family nitrogen assimilation transcriptional regulator